MESVYAPTVTYGHASYTVWPGIPFRERMRITAFVEGVRIEPLLLHVEKSQLMFFFLFYYIFSIDDSLVLQENSTTPRHRIPGRDFVYRLALEHLGQLNRAKKYIQYDQIRHGSVTGFTLYPSMKKTKVQSCKKVFSYSSIPEVYTLFSSFLFF